MRRAGVAAVSIIAICVIAWLHHARSQAPRDEVTTKAPVPVDPRVAAKTSSIGGRVTRASDAPVAGASVAIELALHGPVAPMVVRTNSAGEWMMLVSAGSYRIAVAAIGFAPQRTDAISVARGEVTKVSITLDPGGSVVRGTISDLGGGPIAGARACVMPYCVVTDVEGGYAIAVDDGAHWIDASDDDYCSNSAPFVVSGADATVDVKLVPGASARGDVIARDTGQPIPGATVSISRELSTVGSGTTDDDGTFIIGQLHAGRMFVAAHAPGYASRGETGIEVAPGEVAAPIHLVLDRAFSISGLVVRKDHTQPASGVVVEATGAARSIHVSTTTRDDGTFTLDGLSPTLYAIGIYDGNQSLDVSPVEVRDRDVTDQLYAIAGHGVTVRGRVEPPTHSLVGLLSEQTTNADGGFVFHDIPPGRYSVTASTFGGHDGQLTLDVADHDITNVVVKLDTSARVAVSGTVVDEAGVPVASAMVAVEGHLAGTDAAGRFTVTGLTPGRSLIAASRDIPVYGRNVKYVDAPSMNNVVTVESRHSKITGRVVQPDHQPAPDIMVSATRLEVPDDSVSITSTITAADGTFTLSPLSKGVYSIVARDTRYGAKVEVPRARADDALTITLDPLSSLSGHVTANGAPVTQFELRCGFGELGQKIFAPDGAFKFDHVQPGFYTCTATTHDGNAEASITVGKEPAQLELAVNPYASATGTLVNALTGQPVPGLLAYCDQVRDSYLARGAAISDAAGHFVVDRVVAPTGVVQIAGSADRSTAAQALVNYDALAGQRVDLGEIRVLPPRHGKAGSFGMKTRNLEVVEVSPDGPAALAGIRVGDTIEEVDGISIGTLPRQVIGALLFDQMLTVGDTYRFTLGRAAVTTVTLVAN